MKAQVRYETQGRATRGGERRTLRQRFSPAAGLLAGLLFATMLFAANGQVLADQPGRAASSQGLWAILSAQTQEALARSQHFVSDLRLLYQISQLEPLATESVVAPSAAPAGSAEPECKLISAPQRTEVIVKLEKARS